jgi:alpha-D-ribose 1-methylphosphonate 5-phosphate C-P lyase
MYTLVECAYVIYTQVEIKVLKGGKDDATSAVLVKRGSSQVKQTNTSTT